MYKPIHTFLNRPVQPSYMTNAINSSKLETIFIKEFFIRFINNLSELTNFFADK